MLFVFHVVVAIFSELNYYIIFMIIIWVSSMTLVEKRKGEEGKIPFYL